MAYSLQTVEDDMAAFVATEFPKNTIKAGTYLYHTGFKDTMDTTRKNIHFGLEPSISIWYGLEKLEDALYTKRVPADKHKMFLKENLDAFIIITVHDEILVECHKDVAERCAKIISSEMIEAFNYFAPDVPMRVDAQIGTHWIH